MHPNYKKLSNDVTSKSFIENGLLLSSLSHPHINIHYPIMRIHELSATHMIDSVELTNLVYPFIEENVRNFDILYFYADGCYPLVYNLKEFFKKIVIITSTRYTEYYTEFYQFKDVYPMDSCSDMLDLYNVDNDNILSLIKYYIVDDNYKSVHGILNNITTEDILLQIKDTFANWYEIYTNRNYNIVNMDYDKTLGYAIVYLKVKPEVMIYEL